MPDQQDFHLGMTAEKSCILLQGLPIKAVQIGISGRKYEVFPGQLP